MFDSTMNYIFRSTVLEFANGGPAAALYRNLELTREAYPPQAFGALMNLVGSHDKARPLFVFGEHDDSPPEVVAQARQKLRLAMLFQMTYPGAPAIYYGDEVGVTGAEDPMNRATYPWADRGGHPDLALRADVIALTTLRRENAVLRRGTLLAPLYADEHLLVLARHLGSAWSIVAMNNDANPRSVSFRLPEGAPSAGWRDPLSRAGTPAPVDGALQLTVPGRFGTLLLHP